MGIINLILSALAVVSLILVALSRKIVERLSEKYKVSNICWTMLEAVIFASLFYGDSRNWIWIAYVLILLISVLILYVRGDFANGK